MYNYNLRKYLAIGMETASASMIITGIATRNSYLIAIGGSAGFSFAFVLYDALSEQKKIRKERRERDGKDITKLLESQIMFE